MIEPRLDETRRKIAESRSRLESDGCPECHSHIETSKEKFWHIDWTLWRCTNIECEKNRCWQNLFNTHVYYFAEQASSGY